MRNCGLQLLHSLALFGVFLPSLCFLTLRSRLASFFVSTLGCCLAGFGLLLVLFLIFVAAAAPLLTVLICCSGFLLSCHDFREFFVAVHPLALALLFRIGSHGRSLDDLLASLCAVSARPQLSIGQQDSALLIAAEDLLNVDRLLRLDRVQVLVCLIKANVRRHVNLLRHAEYFGLRCCTLSKLVVTPAEKRAILNAAPSNLIDLLFKHAAFVLINHTQGVSHPLVRGRGHLSTSDLAVENYILAGFEADLANPPLDHLRVPFADSWSNLLFEGQKVS